MDKIEMLNNYAEKCDAIISRTDTNAAKQLFLEIVSVYESEIPDFWNGLQSSMGRCCQGWEFINQYWLVDLPIIKSKLLNYAGTLTIKHNTSRPFINIVNNNNAYATAQNTIDFETSIKTAQKKIAEMESLSAIDTQEALKKLNELLEIAKSKESKKENGVK